MSCQDIKCMPQASFRCPSERPTLNKFLAISGIARKIGAADDYAVGLWKSVLIRQLRWSTDGGCSRPTTRRASSWSWASIDGPIYADAPTEAFLERDYRVVCIIHEVDVKPAVKIEHMLSYFLGASDPGNGNHIKLGDCTRKIVFSA